MPNRAPSIDWSRIVKVIAVAFVAVWLTVASTDPAIGWIIPMAVGGGALIAAVLIATQSRTRHAAPSPDSFARGGLDNVIDISRVRVAGFGGLGLVIVSGIVALQYQLISAALIAGAIGGAVAGVVMILYRRRHGAASATV